MAAMRPVGNGRALPPHAHVRDDATEYVIELDVSDFTERELTVQAIGPRLTIRADQRESPGNATEPFRLHERLEESFRLPDDADPAGVTAFFRHGTLEIHAPRVPLIVRLVPVQHPRARINPDAEPC
jgi:HSP20 family molecular chaperone IbpA